MILGQCAWRNADGPCGFPIEAFRVLPNRERLKMYPVCFYHARMVDARAAKRREASAHIVAEAEDPRGPGSPSCGSGRTQAGLDGPSHDR